MRERNRRGGIRKCNFTQKCHCKIGDSDGHSNGLYVDTVANLVLEQNLFDHNGWNASIPGAEPTIFNQELYIQNTSGLPTVIGNIFANAAAGGAQFRPGGTIIGNLFVKDPISLQIGSTEAGMFASTATVTGNVILQGNDIDSNTPRGTGINLLADTGLVQVQNNIIAHDASSKPYGNGIFIDLDADNDIITNNIIYQWDRGNRRDRQQRQRQYGIVQCD